jgi:hypothetical protein
MLPGDAPTVAWTETEIEAARRECRTALDGLAIDYRELPPLKEGLCGAPAPILVSAVGSDPKVTIEPPATMRCPLAKALAGWVKETVEPKAKEELGATVVKLHNATSYACRNRYGGENAPISEHALANALDVSEFILDSGEKVAVLTAWPQTVAEAPAPSAETPPPNAPPLETRPKLTAADRVPADAGVKLTTAKTEGAAPAAADEKPEPTPQLDAEAKFVRAVHDEACKAFGTVLGPASNAAHKDHFHFDMKVRRSGFCE